MQNRFSQRQTVRGQINDHLDGQTDIRQTDRLTERILEKRQKRTKGNLLQPGFTFIVI